VSISTLCSVTSLFPSSSHRHTNDLLPTHLSITNPSTYCSDTEYVNGEFKTGKRDVSFASPSLVLVPPGLDVGAQSAGHGGGSGIGSGSGPASSSSSGGNRARGGLGPPDSGLGAIDAEDFGPNLAYQPTQPPSAAVSTKSRHTADVDPDLLLALQLQEEEERQARLEEEEARRSHSSSSRRADIDAASFMAQQAQAFEQFQAQGQGQVQGQARPHAHAQAHAQAQDSRENEAYLSQFTPQQLEAMRAQEREYAALARGELPLPRDQYSRRPPPVPATTMRNAPGARRSPTAKKSSDGSSGCLIC
jgi:uncharacterized protein YdaU (DUF1376 family)